MPAQAYSAALLAQWEWVRQLCLCVEQHLKDNGTYFQVGSHLLEGAEQPSAPLAGFRA